MNPRRPWRAKPLDSAQRRLPSFVCSGPSSAAVQAACGKSLVTPVRMTVGGSSRGLMTTALDDLVPVDLTGNAADRHQLCRFLRSSEPRRSPRYLVAIMNILVLDIGGSSVKMWQPFAAEPERSQSARRAPQPLVLLLPWRSRDSGPADRPNGPCGTGATDAPGAGQEPAMQRASLAPVQSTTGSPGVAGGQRAG